MSKITRGPVTYVRNSGGILRIEACHGFNMVGFTRRYLTRWERLLLFFGGRP